VSYQTHTPLIRLFCGARFKRAGVVFSSRKFFDNRIEFRAFRARGVSRRVLNQESQVIKYEKPEQQRHIDDGRK